MRMLSCMKKAVADTLKGVMVMILLGLSLVFSIGLVFRNENVVMYEEGSRRHAQRRHGDDTVGLVFSV